MVGGDGGPEEGATSGVRDNPPSAGWHEILVLTITGPARTPQWDPGALVLGGTPARAYIVRTSHVSVCTRARALTKSISVTR